MLRKEVKTCPVPYAAGRNLTYAMKESTSLTPLPALPSPAFYLLLLLARSCIFFLYIFLLKVTHLFPMLQPTCYTTFGV